MILILILFLICPFAHAGMNFSNLSGDAAMEVPSKFKDAIEAVAWAHQAKGDQEAYRQIINLQRNYAAKAFQVKDNNEFVEQWEHMNTVIAVMDTYRNVGAVVYAGSEVVDGKR